MEGRCIHVVAGSSRSEVICTAICRSQADLDFLAVLASSACTAISSKPASVPAGALINLLLAFSVLSEAHRNTGSAIGDELSRLMSASAAFLAPRLQDVSPDDIVVLAYCMTKLQLRSPELLPALRDAGIPLLGQLDGMSAPSWSTSR